jgi:uncharacterized membrane protein
MKNLFDSSKKKRKKLHVPGIAVLTSRIKRKKTDTKRRYIKLGGNQRNRIRRDPGVCTGSGRKGRFGENKLESSKENWTHMN